MIRKKQRRRKKRKKDQNEMGETFRNLTAATSQSKKHPQFPGEHMESQSGPDPSLIKNWPQKWKGWPYTGTNPRRPESTFPNSPAPTGLRWGGGNGPRGSGRGAMAESHPPAHPPNRAGQRAGDLGGSSRGLQPAWRLLPPQGPGGAAG